MGLFDRKPSHPSPTTPETGYDRVGVPDAGGAIRFVTKADFENLPLLDRVRLLSSGEIVFYRGTEQVNSGEALRRA